VTDRLVVTILGTDRPGLVEALSHRVAEAGGSWQASKMARLAGRFAGVLLVSVPAAASKELEAALRDLAGDDMRVVIDAGDADQGDRALLDFDVVGHDRPGIIREVSSVLAQIDVNIDELESSCESAAMSGASMFRMRARVMVPAGLHRRAVRDALESLSDDLMVDFQSSDES